MNKDNPLKRLEKMASQELLPGMNPYLVANSPGNGFIHGVKNGFIEPYSIPNLSHPRGMGYTH
jgi:hypothetical protein